MCHPVNLVEFLIRPFLWNTSGPFLLSFQLYLNRRFTLLLFSGNFLNSCSFKLSWVVTIQHYTARLLYQTLAKHLTIPSRHLCCRPASVKLQALPCLTCYNGTSPVIFEGGFVFFSAQLFTYGSTDNFWSPIPVSDLLMLCWGNLIIWY